MRILVSNDDGINARGLKVLERVAKTLSKDVWVVAPETEQSGASHSLTLHEPLRIRRLSSRRFAVRGTPTDCMMLAIYHIIKGAQPGLVLSGVNCGANIGDDVTYSGTIAAAMEGAILGVPSIALSQSLRGDHPVKWSTAEHFAPDIIRRLLESGWPNQVLININFPDLVESAVKGVKVTVQGRRDVRDLMIDDRVDARGIPYYWLGFRHQAGAPPAAESDLAAVADGHISLTPLQLDLTHDKTRRDLGRVFM